jgi:transcriptional regulator with XRE-family HTH domain
MSKTSNNLRKVFLNLYKIVCKPIEIASLLNVTRQTVIKIESNELKSNNLENLFNIYKPKEHPLTLNIED